MSTTKACAQCGQPVTQRGRGRPVLFCSTACRVRAHRAARRASSDTGMRQEAEGLARELAEAGRRLVAAVTAAVPDPAAETEVRHLVDRLAALAREAAAGDVLARDDATLILAVTETGNANPAGPEEPDRDELFDALDDLQAALLGELPGELGAALAEPAAALTAAWEEQGGDGDLADLTTAAWQVLDGLADYRHSPVTPPGLAEAAARIAPLLPTRDQTRSGTGGNETRNAMAACQEVYVARLNADDHLVLADGVRVGWIHGAGDGWQVHGLGGALMATLTADGGLHGVARAAAAALGVPGADHAAVTLGWLRDRSGRTIDTDWVSLAAWTLLRGRVPGREDVIVRGRCVGWLQRDRQGRFVACTLEGPVPGSASATRQQAVMALFALLYAPAPLPDLGPDATAARKPQARSRQRPISHYTEQELAAAALNPPKTADGYYLVIVDGTELGRVHRFQRHWSAHTADGHTAVHRAGTRTEAIDRLLAVPGPLFGDPADATLHDLYE